MDKLQNIKLKKIMSEGIMKVIGVINMNELQLVYIPFLVFKLFHTKSMAFNCKPKFKTEFDLKHTKSIDWGSLPI